MSETETYYATYCRLDTTSGDSHVNVEGNSVVVGSELALTEQLHVTERGKELGRIVISRGDQAFGFLPAPVYKQVAKFMADGWTCRAFAVVDIFDKRVNEHTVEVAVFCYPSVEGEIFNIYIGGLEKRIAKGEHPVVTLSQKELERVVETHGAWDGAKSQKLPKLEKGSAYYKTRRTFTENMALAAAEGNKGCWAGLFIVTFIVIFTILWFLFLR